MIVLLSILIVIVFFFLTNNPKFLFKESIHEDARIYHTRHCLVFYPNSAYGRKKAKQIARQEKGDKILDYSLVPYGDYYLVSYSDTYNYLADKQFNEIIIRDINDETKKIFLDYLRYDVKKDKSDLYYSSTFMDETSIENFVFDNLSYKVDKDNLNCYVEKYDINVEVPLRDLEKALGMNFGYEEKTYIKPTYIDTSGNHPIICLTFDDGPQFYYPKNESSSVKIVDALNSYDACGTFFVVGDCLNEESVWSEKEKKEFLSNSISRGNEYGSHTMSHDYLIGLTYEELNNTILGPNEILNKLTNYEMSLYRPTEGEFDYAVTSAQPYPAILWDVDSYDWDLADGNQIFNNLKDIELNNGDIIIFHDLYNSSADAIEKLVPYLLEKGYQLLTVSDMLEGLNINKYDLSYYYNYYPSPYYE